MLQHEKIISLLSTEKKLRLLISNEAYTTGECEGFNFPKIHFINDFNDFEKKDDYAFTAFPSDTMLLNSFDMELINKVHQINALNISKNNPYYFNQYNTSLAINDLTNEEFLLASYLVKSKTMDDTAVDDIVDSYDDYASKTKNSFPLYYFNKKCDTKWVIVHNLNDYKYFKKMKPNVRFVASCDNKNDLFDLFYENIAFAFYTGDDYDNVISYLVGAVDTFENEKNKMLNEFISLAAYQDEIKSHLIYDNTTLDLKLNDLFDLFKSLDIVKDEAKDLVNDYKKENDLAFKASLSSIVMLKNNDNLLPLNNTVDVAIVGDWFKDSSYLESRYTNKINNLCDGFKDVISYDNLNVIGYAHGYLKNHDDLSLVSVAKTLASKASVVIMFLWSDDGKLSASQEELLKTINSMDKKIVAVVNSKKPLDTCYNSYCDAILYMADGGEAVVKATLSIINGDHAPQGFLAYDYYENGNLIYPLGYGLSYGTVELKNPTVTASCASVTVTNTTDSDSSVLVLFYVSKDEGYFSTRRLRGFKKVHLAKTESKKLDFYFDDATFREYIDDKHGYGVIGKEYNVTFALNSADEGISETLELRRELENYYECDSYNEEEAMEASIKEYLGATIEEEKPYSKKKIVFVSIMGAYFVLALAVTAVFLGLDPSFNVTNSIGYSFFACIGILVFVIIAFSIAIRSYVKARNSVLKERRTLEYHLSHLPDFSESNIESFEKPVLEEEAIEDNTVEAEAYQEPEVIESAENVDNSLDELVEQSTLSDEDIEAHEEEIRRIEEINEQALFGDEEDNYQVSFDSNSSLNQIAVNLKKLALCNGINIEASSVRSLLSAVSTSHLVIMNSSRKDLLINMLNVFASFLGDEVHILQASEAFVSEFNLCWKQNENGEYTKTDFITNIFNAGKRKDNLNLAVINNVDMKNASLYLNSIIDFAYNPKGRNTIKINNNVSLPIPSNMCFIIIPNSDDYLNNMPLKLAEASMSVELLLSDTAAVDTDEEFYCLSNTYLEDLIYEAKKTKYIKEEAWKKIDNLFIELNKLFPISMNPKLTAMIERYAAVAMDCGDLEIDVIDLIVAEKIIPQILASEYLKKPENHKFVIEILNKVFGEENIARSLRVMNNALKKN